MSREEQQARLAEIVELAKTAGLKIRWWNGEIVVIGLPPLKADAEATSAE